MKKIIVISLLLLGALSYAAARTSAESETDHDRGGGIVDCKDGCDAQKIRVDRNEKELSVDERVGLASCVALGNCGEKQLQTIEAEK